MKRPSFYAPFPDEFVRMPATNQVANYFFPGWKYKDHFGVLPGYLD